MDGSKGGRVKGWKGRCMGGWMDDHEQTKNDSMHVTFLQNPNLYMKS
jgi:hypothetical protein